MIRRQVSGLLSNHCRRSGGYCCLMAATYFAAPSSSSSSIIRNNHKIHPMFFPSCNSNVGFDLLSRRLKPPTKTICVNKPDGNFDSKSLYIYRRPNGFTSSLPQLLRLDSGNGAHYTNGLPDPNRPEKLVVAVDVDEVLGNFISALNKFIAARYNSNHSVSEYHVYEFFRIWNCSREEAAIRVHEFFKTSYFKMGIHPIPGAQQALQKLSRFCNLSVVTSRQNAIKDHTIEWIEQHFPGLFQEIHFGNHFALDGHSRPKSEICRSMGAKILIDDNPRYAAECAEAGIKVLLFDYENSYPWCKENNVAQHPLVVKVHNWQEVENQLVPQAVSQNITP